MGHIRVGLSSWTDKSLLQSGKFYPSEVRQDAEARLRYYAQQFPDLVEVNSTYYALPSERNAHLWNQRTPDGFLFDIKLYSLFTHHPTRTNRMPKDIRESLDAETAKKSRIYWRDMPEELTEELLRRYRLAIAPLHDTDKLGAVLAQFPRWFFPGEDSLKHILWLKEHLGDYSLAIEFRNGDWLDENHREATFGFLDHHNLTYVCVDEPQGYRSSVPPITEVTNSALSYVRFHGRRQEMWEKKGATVAERFKYLYSEDELKEWVPKLEGLAEQAAQVHVLLNNNYEDYAVRNARQLRLLLGQED